MSMNMMGSNVRIHEEQVKKEQSLLQRGDVIRLEPGMMIYADIPSMFRGGAFFDKKNCHREIKIGQVYKSTPQSAQALKEEVYEKIWHIIPVDKQQVSDFVNSLSLDLEEKSFDSSVYAGEYVVYSAVSNGGAGCWDGTPYPDGWHVYCHKVDDPSVEVDFYQTGCFTAMIKDIKPISNK